METYPNRKKGGRSDFRASQTVLKRILVVMLICGILFFVPLIVQLYKVQIVNHGKYEAMAIDQQTLEYSLTASRGTIYDRNKKILAYSASAEKIFLSPLEIAEHDQDIDLIATKLSEILGADYDSIVSKAKKTYSQYEVVANKVDQSVADEVRRFISDYDIYGIHMEETSKRYYPYSSLAAQVIGFVGTDNYGLSGIEAAYDDTLNGTDGLIVTAKDGHGREMLFRYEQYFDAEDGNSLVLTLDSAIQFYLEKNLASAVEDFDVLNGAFGLVMDVNTGEVLGMASLKSFDPNKPNEIGDQKVRDFLNELKEVGNEEYPSLLVQAQYNQWRNRVVNDTYEPGSTFKSITMAIALEENIVSLSDGYFCSGSTGSMYIGGRDEPITCWKKAGHGQQTLAQTLANSCNPAFATYALRIGGEKFYDYLEAFGFFDETDIDLPGESGSIFWPDTKSFVSSEIGQASLAVGSFGQTFKITPIQLATAYCSIVNGGYLLKPYLIKQVLDSDGNVIQDNTPTVVRQVISEQTSKTMREMLELVVSGGSGKNAQLSGYRIGGKTGTSEKIDQATDDLMVSFYGIAPIDNPQIVVAIILDTPSKSTGLYISGGIMAAPVASSLFADILPYLGLDPSYTETELATKDIVVPDLIGKSLDDARAALDNKFSVRIVGNGEFVTAQTPNALSEIPAGSTVIVYLGEQKDTRTVEMPNLVGWTAARVKAELTYLGLYMHKTGNINTDLPTVVACRQSVAAGKEVEVGTVIEVQFSDTNVGDR